MGTSSDLRGLFGFSVAKLKGEPVFAVLAAPSCLVFVLLTFAALTCCFFGGGNPLVGGQDAKCRCSILTS